MKLNKLLCVFMVLAMCISIAACSVGEANGEASAQATAEPVQETEEAITEEPKGMMTGMPNPLHEACYDDVLNEIGVALPAPTFAHSVSWFTYDTKPAIGEMRFQVGEQNYNYRVCSASKFDDISGMYYTWTVSSTEKVDYNDATVSVIPGEQGIIQWYDAAPGLMYSLSVDSGADSAALAEMANKIYQPTQGEADGDFSVDGTLYGNVISATNNDFYLNVNGMGIHFLISKSTVINTAYFDTGDYLCVSYHGELMNDPTAVQIDKIQVVYPTVAPQPTAHPTAQPTIEPMPIISPVPNPMISGTGYLDSWGAWCELSPDGGIPVTLSTDGCNIMPGYFPHAGDYVSFTYNSGLGTLTDISPLVLYNQGDDPVVLDQGGDTPDIGSGVIVGSDSGPAIGMGATYTG